jgi:exodeoxyribonuclease VII small subunit
MSDDLDELTFEEAFRDLEAAVQRLEAGDLTLEEALALYERGMLLAERCSKALDAAEIQVQKLVVADEKAQMGMFFEEQGE